MYTIDWNNTADGSSSSNGTKQEIDIEFLTYSFTGDDGRVHLALHGSGLRLQKFGRRVAWLDTGTPEALLQAANFVQTIQERQGLRASCPEKISFRTGWIDAEQLARLAKPLEKTEYGQYLHALSKGLDV